MKLSRTKDAAIDTAEAIVDAAGTYAKGILNGVLDNDLVKGLPIVKYGFAALEAYQTIQNSILLKKIQPFFDELASVATENRQEMVKRLERSDYSEDVGFTILDYLNRAQLDRKPKMIGMIFKALAEEKCTLEQFWRLLNVVDKLTLQDIQRLRSFNEESSRQTVPEYMKQAYVTVGLARTSALLGKGMDFEPIDLCEKFIELNLDVELHDTL